MGLRYRSPLAGKERLSEAREAADKARRLLRDGKDPIEHRNDQRAADKANAAQAVTFREHAEAYISRMEAGWKNAKQRQQ